jgi:hypothetical protein
VPSLYQDRVIVAGLTFVDSVRNICPGLGKRG